MSNSISGSTGTNSGTEAGAFTGANAKIANQEVFMKLLVEQLKNQDPLNPMDGTQFVAQLAQFSELEQVIQIRQDVQSMVEAAAAANSSTGN